MEIGVIGLGRMGINMARRLLRDGHRVVAYNRTVSKIEEIAAEGAVPARSAADLVEGLTAPRAVWMMLPAGPVVAGHLDILADLLAPGDTVIDGGNSYYKDTAARAEWLKKRGVHFVDVGVSGGIWGLTEGYCLMAGGAAEACASLEPVFGSLAQRGGYLYCGKAGAGHFVKMVHNGIEYGMMQAYGEGFDLLENSPYAGSIDHRDVAGLWNRGSVVRSWLLELLEEAFSKDPKLEGIRGYVEDSGEGRWCVRQAVESGVSAPVIALSLMGRFRSRQADTFAERVTAALRKEFGGHATLPAQDK